MVGIVMTLAGIPISNRLKHYDLECWRDYERHMQAITAMTPHVFKDQQYNSLRILTTTLEHRVLDLAIV
jgi:hypothetical protein